MIDIMRTALRSIGRKRGRSLLTVMGITIGVMSVIIISNISSCGTEAVSGELDGLGLGGIVISQGTAPSAELSKIQFDIIKTVKGVDKATPMLVLNSSVDSRSQTAESLLWGIDSTAPSVIALNLMYGRFINSADISSCAKVCMVDRTFAQSFYNRDNIVGKKITVTSSNITDEYEVVGVLKTGGGILQNFMGSYIPNFVYAPYSTIQNITGSSNFHQIIVRTSKSSDPDKVGESIIGALSRDTGTKDAYEITNLAKQREALSRILSMITLILSAVGGISLLVASLSIMTVMLVSVSERTREIGIKKSIGAGKTVILTEFLLEASFISLIGCISGLILGTAVSYIGAGSFNIDLKIRYDIMLYVSLLSLATGLVFGVYPAYKAACLRPVDALRSE